MWKILIEKKALKGIGAAPEQIQKKFEAWTLVARFNGVAGLVAVNGYRDHPLKGIWDGYRSSSLNQAWRVIYRVEGDIMEIKVVRVSNHDYS